MTYSTNLASKAQDRPCWVLECVTPSGSEYFSTLPVTGLTESAVIKSVQYPSYKVDHRGGGFKVGTLGVTLQDVLGSDNATRKVASVMSNPLLIGNPVFLYHGYQGDAWDVVATAVSATNWKHKWAGYIKSADPKDGTWTLKCQDALSKAVGKAADWESGWFSVAATDNADLTGDDYNYFSKDEFLQIKKMVNMPSVLGAIEVDSDDMESAAAWTDSTNMVSATSATYNHTSTGTKSLKLISTAGSNPGGYVERDAYTIPNPRVGECYGARVYAKRVATAPGNKYHLKVAIEGRRANGTTVTEVAYGASRKVENNGWGHHSATIHISNPETRFLVVRVYASTKATPAAGTRAVWVDDYALYHMRETVAVKREVYGIVDLTTPDPDTSPPPNLKLEITHGALNTRECSQRAKQKGRRVKCIVGDVGRVLLRLLTSTSIEQETPATPLSLSISVDDDSGTAPHAVTFAASCSGGSGTYTYSWLFGDGQGSTTQNPSHTYTAEGDYIATCIVEDTGTGQSTYMQLSITVAASVPLAFTVVTSPDPPITSAGGGNVQFTYTFSGGTGPYTLTTDYGGPVGNLTGAASTSPRVETILYPGFITDKAYPTTHTLTDSAGTPNTRTVNFNVTVPGSMGGKTKTVFDTVSPYDFGDGWGAGIPIELIDVESFLNLSLYQRANVGDMQRVAFVFDKPETDLMKLIDKEILQPFGLWLHINKDGLIAVRNMPWHEYIGSETDRTITDASLAGKASISRKWGDMVTALQYRIDHDALNAVETQESDPWKRKKDKDRSNSTGDKNYAGRFMYDEADHRVSLAWADEALSKQSAYGLKIHAVKSRGIRSHVSHAIGMPCPTELLTAGRYEYWAWTGDLAGRSLASRLLNYYSDPVPWFACTLFAEAMEWEIGDIVKVTNSYLPDMSSSTDGTDGFTAIDGILLEKKVDAVKMTVSATIALVGWCDSVQELSYQGTANPTSAITVDQCNLATLNQGNYPIAPLGKFTALRVRQDWGGNRATPFPEDSNIAWVEVWVDWMSGGTDDASERADDSLGWVMLGRFKDARYILAINGANGETNPMEAFNVRAYYRYKNGGFSSVYYSTSDDFDGYNPTTDDEYDNDPEVEY